MIGRLYPPFYSCCRCCFRDESSRERVQQNQEHQADQFGLEVTHGLTPNSGQVAAQAFQVLGEVDLADPDPNPVDVFLYYSHPPISDRVSFSVTYSPWEHGGGGEFVK